MVLLDIVFYSFIVIVTIQLIFYTLFFGDFAFHKPKKVTKKNIAISVIICAKNEAKNLKQFLSSIINQDYPNFEIVLINDDSSDNTLDIMEEFAKQNKHIKIVNIKSIEPFWGNKKYALTLGIKTAANDFLLFTDADCKTLSKNWISEMSSHFTNTKTIVLGFSQYVKKKYSLLNLLIRFETLLTAISYFSFAKIGLPYMAVGRNLAYRKDEFFNANGFMNHMQIRSGDDDLFVNQIATAKNTTICLTKNSFTESEPEISFKAWLKQKRRHVSTAKHYKIKHQLLLGIFYVSQILFWALSIILLIFLFNWQIVGLLILLRFIIQFLVFGFSAKKLNTKDVLFALPFLELFLILFQLTIFIANLVSKPNHWK